MHRSRTRLVLNYAIYLSTIAVVLPKYTRTSRHCAEKTIAAVPKNKITGPPPTRTKTLTHVPHDTPTHPPPADQPTDHVPKRTVWRATATDALVRTRTPPEQADIAEKTKYCTKKGPPSTSSKTLTHLRHDPDPPTQTPAHRPTRRPAKQPNHHVLQQYRNKYSAKQLRLGRTRFLSLNECGM